MRELAAQSSRSGRRAGSRATMRTDPEQEAPLVLDSASEATPVTAEARVDRRTYRDLKRALRTSRTPSIFQQLRWSALIFGALLAAAAGGAYWVEQNISWSYVGSDDGPIGAFLRQADDFTIAFALLLAAALAGLLAYRIIWLLTAAHAHRTSRAQGAIVNGAQVLMDPSGVSVSGTDFGSRWGWNRIEDVYRGRKSLVIVVAQGGLPLTYASLSLAPGDAAERIQAWRSAARDRSLRAD